jgi:hypothetical protein
LADVHRYRLCGDAVSSAIALPELERSPGTDGDRQPWVCRPGTIPAAGPLIHEWRDREGDSWLRISRCGGDYHLAFDVSVAFLVSGRDVTWSADASIPPQTLRHLLLDQVLPLAMSGQGAFVLHGSAVSIGGRAALFVGESGRGKSTLAAWLAANGHVALADDCLRIEEREGGVFVAPAYPSLRVWPDTARHVCHDAAATLTQVAHYSRKLRMDVANAGDAPVPVERIYLLRAARGRDPEIDRSIAASIVDLVSFVFRIDVTRRDILARDFSTASRLVEGSLVRYLDVPRSLDALPRVAQLIRADMAAPVAVSGEACA